MLTVIMPTHNGADTLPRTLAAFAALAEPRGGWKLVLADNASTDATTQVIDGFRERLPLDYVQEPRLGKAFALNTAIERAEGDLVVFTDDDVIPEADWLVQWRRIADEYPDFGVFGGAIVPEFARPPPAWLAPTSWPIVLYTATKQGRPDGAMAAGEMDVYGPNMAVRADMLARGLRFDTRLMVGQSALLGDETDLVDRAVEQGARVGFAASARVRHIVEADQVSLKWMLRRFYRHGRTMFFFDVLQGRHDTPMLRGAPRYLYRRILTRGLSLPLVAGRLDRFRLVSHLRLLAYDLGAFAQARRMFGPASETAGAASAGEDRPTASRAAASAEAAGTPRRS